MAATRLLMRRLRDILRLKYEAGLVTRSHHAQPSGLEVEVGRIDHAGERMGDHHHRALEPLPTFNERGWSVLGERQHTRASTVRFAPARFTKQRRISRSAFLRSAVAVAVAEAGS